MLSAARLTFRIHRFEVVVAVVVTALAALALAYLTLQIRDLAIPDGCWPRDYQGDYALPDCERLLDQFWRVQSSGGNWARAILSFLAPVLGILLGVSIVAREVELRTAELAWSLSRRRSRWLIQRVVPMLVLALVLLIVLGALGWWYFDALAQGRLWPELTELASTGVALVARGLLAMGVALLIGAITGRTMPALVLTVIAMVAWSVVAVPAYQHQVAQEVAVWQSENAWQSGEGELLYLRRATFDVSRPPGKEGQPGARFKHGDKRALLVKTCGPNPNQDATVDADKYYDCKSAFGDSIRFDYVVPQSAFGLLQGVDAAISLLLGGVAFLLTFPIVARRRPS